MAPTAGVVVFVKDGTYWVEIRGKEVDRGKDILDPTVTPNRIDSLPAKGKPQLGIYELKGDAPSRLLRAAGGAAADEVRGEGRQQARPEHLQAPVKK